MLCLLIDKNVSERLRIAGLLRSLGLECTVMEALPVGALTYGVPQPQLVLFESSSADIAQTYLHHLQLGHRERAAPTVFCYTKEPQIEDMAACILAGAADYLVQPFDKKLLKFKLQQAGVLQH